ncbi:chaperone NapD [Pasteurellaceae bacterium HPA106]|uniref:chaperone NapD n=1 Tax=Spirabiliibacterium pneumoniae TaxID=221400 RepID=UPI001AAD0D33|nr:chaperone NapD [Spirabiliibacterium pneumoniae]MBE2896917.1 chaperone NapD [Spirabiliibacterium pneumoniae]
MGQSVSKERASEWHVCGLVVQCRPQDVAQVKTALLALALTDVSAIDEAQGKLVVVMESNNQADLLERMELARNIDGVLALSLVYHQQDQDTLVGE